MAEVPAACRAGTWGWRHLSASTAQIWGGAGSQSLLAIAALVMDLCLQGHTPELLQEPLSCLGHTPVPIPPSEGTPELQGLCLGCVCALHSSGTRLVCQPTAMEAAGMGEALQVPKPP